jgi:hypothetical protein
MASQASVPSLHITTPSSLACLLPFAGPSYLDVPALCVRRSIGVTRQHNATFGTSSGGIPPPESYALYLLNGWYWYHALIPTASHHTTPHHTTPHHTRRTIHYIP